MPRRRIEITVRLVDHPELPLSTHEAMNPRLEQWYNEGSPEQPTFTPYHFLLGPRRDDPEVNLAD